MDPTSPSDPSLNLPELIEGCATLPLTEVLARVETQAGWPDGSLDVWLWDYRNQSLASIRTGAPGGPRTLVGAVPITVLGCEIGVLTTTNGAGGGPSGGDPDGSPAADRVGMRVVAAAVGLALRAQEHVVDQVAVTRRQGRQLSLAAELQWSLLAPAPLRLGSWLASAALEPAYECGGDVYDVALAGERLHVAVLDAVGHGLRSAQISAVALAALRQGRREGDPLAALAERIDVAVTASLDSGFVTGILVEADLASGAVRWLSAGHPPPLLLGADGEVVELDLVASVPFGLRLEPGPAVRPVRTLRLEVGQSLVLYSDGVLENLALESRAPVGRHRFGQLLGGVLGDEHPHPARGVSDLLLADTGPVLRDDATVVVVRHLA